MIYASEGYSTPLLEMLVHWNGVAPPKQHIIEITIPKGTSYGIEAANKISDWFHPGRKATRRSGRQWCGEHRSAILIVPTVVARMERNVAINRRHPKFEGMTVGPKTPVW